MALDIHDWEDERKSVQIGEETLDGNGNESVVGDGMDNGQGKEEMVAEDKCKESDLSVNDPVGEEALQARSYKSINCPPSKFSTKTAP